MTSPVKVVPALHVAGGVVPFVCVNFARESSRDRPRRAGIRARVSTVRFCGRANGQGARRAQKERLAEPEDAPQPEICTIFPALPLKGVKAILNISH